MIVTQSINSIKVKVLMTKEKLNVVSMKKVLWKITKVEILALKIIKEYLSEETEVAAYGLQ